tara:strand:- start:3446 stop:3739 length:294 start_codon:yes stop_codon:yes gene_type:complete
MTEEVTFPERDWPAFDMVEAMNDLSLGEMEEWEDITSLVFTTVMNGGMPAKGITALMFVMARRQFPDLVIEEVRKRTINDLESKKIEEDVQDEVDPT